MPFVSYAVAQNLDDGCDSDLFLSHAWDEGIFEFGSVVSKAWPKECHAAYICFVANPQNLDIASLIKTPKDSPFYRVLASQPREMLMVANRNVPIHSRLWCVYEAHKARQFHIATRIAGDPLWLVSEKDRPRAKEILRRIQQVRMDGREVESLVVDVALDVRKAESGRRS